MINIGTVFNFMSPQGWEFEQKGDRYVFHGPEGEQLIVTATLIQGGGKTTEFMTAQHRLFENAKRSVKSAANHPALRVVRPFQRDSVDGPLERWSILAQTHDGLTLFYQAVFREERGVLLLTYEAQNIAAAISVFLQVISSVQIGR